MTVTQTQQEFLATAQVCSVLINGKVRFMEFQNKRLGKGDNCCPESCGLNELKFCPQILTLRTAGNWLLFHPTFSYSVLIVYLFHPFYVLNILCLFVFLENPKTTYFINYDVRFE